MANRDQCGNREKLKRKKDKPKSAAHISTFGASAKSAAGKKRG